MDREVRAGRVVGQVTVPGSKSVAQRALLIASRKGGRVRNVPESDDIDRLCDGLRALGYSVSNRDGDYELSGELNESDVEIDAGDNGTAARCLTALAAVRAARTTIDGSPRLRERPVQPLCAALRELGATIDGDRFPVTVRGPIRGAAVRVSTDLSSQFASALILLVDRVKGLRVNVGGRRSLSYVGLTAHVMRGYRDPYTVEPDASSAAPFAVASATTGGDLLLRGVSLSSPQPDARLLPYLNRAGARVTHEAEGVRVRGGRLSGIQVDLADSPDIAPLLAVLGALAEGETVVTGAPHLIHKESDRIAATVAMIRSLGGEATALEDGFRVRGGRPLEGGRISAHNDHRIAMAAGVLALSVPGVTVTGAEAVRKSYPGFFRALESLTE